MKFLTIPDLNERISATDRAVLAGDNSPEMNRAEVDAISQATSYLNARFNTSLIFVDLVDYDEFQSYTAGTVISTGSGVFILGSDIGPTTVYNSLDEYTAGTELYFPNTGNLIYRVITDTVANQDPFNTPQKFELVSLEDPREAMLVRCLADVLIYLLHARVNVRAIPEFRQMAYDDAVKWFKECANPRFGMTPEKMPLKDHGINKGNDITFGGVTRFPQSNTY